MLDVETTVETSMSSLISTPSPLFCSFVERDLFQKAML